MKTIQYFNIYQRVQTSILQRIFCFVFRYPGVDGPSPKHRTLTGPFDTAEEAAQSLRRYDWLNKDFVKTISVEFDLGPEELPVQQHKGLAGG